MCVRRCDHCNAVGTELQGEFVHIGGIGYRLVYYCVDQQACWRRWWEHSVAIADGELVAV